MLRRKQSNYQSRRDVQWLVAGLGNPGREYEGSPHNVGFAVVSRIAERHRISLVGKHDGLFGVGSIGGIDVALLQPLTFMNLSGRSVKPALRSLGLAIDQLLVVHDEIDLDYGRVQLKMGGGLAGHNGLRSIADSCGSRDFARLRVGVGRPEPGDRRPISDWILRPFQPPRSTEELSVDASAAVELVIESGLRAAMNHVNVAG